MTNLAVKVYVDGCRAKVIKVDKEADLALLEMCRNQRQAKAPKFETAPSKDDKLFLIARPHGDKVVSHGSFYGNYMLGNSGILVSEDRQPRRFFGESGLQLQR